MEAQDDQENNGSCEKGPSSSSSNAFKVKIKIPKLVKDEEKVNVDGGGDEDAGKEDENKVCEEKINFFAKLKKDHICCECGKEFSSGKALGGHMSSAHVQANQRLEELRKRKKNFSQEKSSKLMKRFDDEEDFGDGDFDNHEMMKIICDICGKDFPSKKSLFGHMRCHPDRDWRGMKPPSASKKNSKNGGFRASFPIEYDDDDDADGGGDDRFDVLRFEEEEERGVDVNVVARSPPPLRVDLKDCLKSWGVTDRRGRSPLAKKRSISGTSSDEEGVHVAAQQLIRLVNGDNNNNNNNNNSEVICSSNSVSSAPKEASLSGLKDKSKRKAVVDDTEEENRGETCSDSPVHKKKRREKEVIKLEPGKDPVPSPVIKKTPDVKYKCNICGKVFASHQALGGHRSSHNKFKITIENTIDHHQDQEIKARNQENNTQDHTHQDVQLGNPEINNCNIIDQHGSNNNNKCKICDKIFPTGQALGGHQRSHWTNNQEESSSQNASKVLDFDLNELPDLDDDDYYR